MRYSDTEIQEFQRHFTSCHFKPYLDVSANFTDALDIYQINIQLCEAFYPCLHAVEIALRNSIYNVLQDKYGQDWLSCNNSLLDDRERDQIDKSKVKLKNRGCVNISDNIISEMSFGFWTSLIEKKCYENTIWKPCCKKIFLHADPKKLDLKIIRNKIKNILYLRNKVFHHNSIWNNKEICSIYEDIYQLIFWINPKVFTWSKKFDRFTEVYHRTSKLLDVLYKG